MHSSTRPQRWRRRWWRRRWQRAGGRCQRLSWLPERRLGGGMVPVVNLRPQQRAPHTPASHQVPGTNNPRRSAAVCPGGWKRGRQGGRMVSLRRRIRHLSLTKENAFIYWRDDANHKLFHLISNKCVFAASFCKIKRDLFHDVPASINKSNQIFDFQLSLSAFIQCEVFNIL